MFLCLFYIGYLLKRAKHKRKGELTMLHRLLSLIQSSTNKLINTLTTYFAIPEGVHYINGPEILPPPLASDEEKEVFAKLDGDERESAKNTLIVHNLRLVVYIARRFENSGLGVEDLISIGTIGLIKAVNTFCPQKGIKLATYASRCIENEILMYLRKCQPQKHEISIDEPLNVDWDGNELLLSDILGTEPDVISRPLELDAERASLAEAVERLGEREKLIMKLRFGLVTGEEKTQKQVADIVGISQSYISRLEKRIIKQLRREMERVSM